MSLSKPWALALGHQKRAWEFRDQVRQIKALEKLGNGDEGRDSDNGEDQAKRLFQGEFMGLLISEAGSMSAKQEASMSGRREAEKTGGFEETAMVLDKLRVDLC